MNLKDELLGIIRALNDANIKYAVCGGLALTIHGFVRSTIDIDLLVPEDQVDSILTAVKPLGFWIPSGRMPMKFKANTPEQMSVYRVSKAAGSILIPLDLIAVSPALQRVWDSREVYEVDGLHCPVVSRSGLIQMKSLAGRPQDQADIARLMTDE